jgi:hypothetical protein
MGLGVFIRRSNPLSASYAKRDAECGLGLVRFTSDAVLVVDEQKLELEGARGAAVAVMMMRMMAMEARRMGKPSKRRMRTEVHGKMRTSIRTRKWHHRYPSLENATGRRRTLLDCLQRNGRI